MEAFIGDCAGNNSHPIFRVVAAVYCNYLPRAMAPSGCLSVFFTGKWDCIADRAPHVVTC